MTLTEFLLARIAEDEEFIGAGWLEDAPFDMDRVLVECQEKRALISLAKEIGLMTSASVQHILALSYVDHPDYLPEWRP